MNTLRKLSGLVALSALVLVTLLLSANGASAQQQQDGPVDYITNYYFGFDTTLQPWIAYFDGTTKQPGLELLRVPKGNGCAPLHEGSGYAKLQMNSIVSTSKPDTGNSHPLPVGTWMMTSIPVEGPSAIKMDFAALSASNCQGCHAMVFIGSKEPQTTDFVYEREGLSTKWQQYTYEKPVYTGGKAFVAVGFANVNAGVGFDCINIRIQALARPGVEGSNK